MTDQSTAMRNAMKLDAEWHRADAAFNAACEVRDEATETLGQRRTQWMKEYHARPGRRKRRNARRRSQRRAERATYKSLLTRPGKVE